MHFYNVHSSISQNKMAAKTMPTTWKLKPSKHLLAFYVSKEGRADSFILALKNEKLGWTAMEEFSFWLMQ